MHAARDVASVVLSDLPVALVRRADPALQGRPVAVARGATVVAVSAEAHAEGVGPGTPVSRARHRAVVRPLDPEAVARVRAEVGAVLNRYTPRVESAGGGAWYLDLSGTRRYFRKPPVDLLSEASLVLREELRLPTRAAMSSGKAVARMTAALGDERVTRILPGAEPSFVRGFPVSVLPGLGAVQRSRLERLGLYRLGDLATVPLPRLEGVFGASGRLWGQWSRGLDPRPVAGWAEEADIDQWYLSLPLSPQEQSLTAAGPALLGAAERLGRALRDRAERAGRLRLTVVHRDGVERARSARLEPTDRDFELFEAASALLRAIWERRVAVRRVTVAVSERISGGQGELFPADARMDRLLRGLDAVRDRFGAYAVQWGRRLDGGT
ncbi:DNA polymerase Y family protein [Thiohalorhabdus sp. Cl-TMA]|uniref:UmuC domain-containing protein n=1 Tax=Thiohalorhabdus methylotrophus TaxID=3242694 RepID=A0ABV4TX40_9GAMM